MDHQQAKSRPQHLVAAKPKIYTHSHATRKTPNTQAQSATARNSPPNSNARSVSQLSPASPGNQAAPSPDPSDVELEAEGDDVIIMAAPEITADVSQSPVSSHAATSETEIVKYRISSNMEEYFQKTTERFERMISGAVDSFLGKLHQLEQNLGASLEFEHKRVNELVENQNGMKNQIKSMEKEIAELRQEVERNKMATNKSERFSRRNNVRVVGVPEAPQGTREDPVAIVEEIFHSKFKVKTKVERAHRDGKKVDGLQGISF